MEKVVSNYNNTPNKSINDIKPNEAHLEKNIKTIFGINVFKKKGMTIESDLVRGRLWLAAQQRRLSKHWLA